MEFALQYELQRSRPHYPGFMYDIYNQATEQVKLADRLGYLRSGPLSIIFSRSGRTRRRLKSGTARSAR
jgi:hypothetical protein